MHYFRVITLVWNFLMWFAPALWHRAGANPWSSVVEGDEQLDRPNSQTTTMEFCHALLHMGFFLGGGVNINTIAFCLGWCSLHLLLLKSSLAHVNDLEQQINTLLMLRLSRQRGMQVRRILFKIYSRLSGWRLPTFEPDPGRIVDIP